MQRANAVALQSSGVDEGTRDTGTSTRLMTPARRAGLDALEREFTDLLAAYQSRFADQSAAA